MKNLTKHTTSIGLALILLVSTLQVSIYKMECLMSGATKISLSDFDDCNKSPKDDCSVTEQCCCFHQMDLNFDFDTELGEQGESLAIAQVSLETSLEPALIVEKNQLLFATDLPPPGGKELLKRIQVFRL